MKTAELPFTFGDRLEGRQQKLTSEYALRSDRWLKRNVGHGILTIRTTPGAASVKRQNEANRVVARAGPTAAPLPCRRAGDVGIEKGF